MNIVRMAHPAATQRTVSFAMKFFILFSMVMSPVSENKIILAAAKKTGDHESDHRNLVGVAGVEPTASWTRTKRATNCATPRYSSSIIRNFNRDVKRDVKVIFPEKFA